MSTSTGPDRSPPQTEISSRKAHHLDICVAADRYSVEHGRGAGFDHLSFVHNALPELHADKVDTSCTFLECDLALPLFISCMTGGGGRGRMANRELAHAAQQARIPIGLGSVRVLFDNEDVFPDFHVKPLAPDVPVLANLGVVQVRDIPRKKIYDLMQRLEVQALVVHLNPGQELAQAAGDRDFSGLLEALARLMDGAPLPIIIKETGFGIRPGLVHTLLQAGAAFVDVAGSGGTNWMTVEGYRDTEARYRLADAFVDWGLPTAPLLDVIGSCGERILASGGLRCGMDLAKSVALGAVLGGMALPLIRIVIEKGREGVLEFVAATQRELSACMLLTGAANLKALSRKPLIRSPQHLAWVEQLQNIEGRE